MITNLVLDSKLIKEAIKEGRHKTKEEAVTEALRRYVNSFKQKEILALFGKISFEKDYDFKKGRKNCRRIKITNFFPS